MYKKGMFGLVVSVLLLLLLALTALAVGPSFTYHTIQTNFADCTSVGTADLNSDGKVDVMASAPGLLGIKWWQNSGSGNFSSSSQLSNGFVGATTMYADDFDEDGDWDVVAYSNIFKNLAWFENKGSNTWQQRYMSLNSPTAIAPLSFDAENSGERYVLAANGMHKDIEYVQPDTTADGYELGGKMDDAFTDIEKVSALYVEDMDRDGKADAIIASHQYSDLSWYNQQKLGYSVSIYFPQSTWISSHDLDQDGDPDILGSSDTLGLFWWENKNGQATLWDQHAITRYDIYVGSSLHTLDLDNDGDLDIIGATKKELVWWENLGNPTQASGWLRHKIADVAGNQGYNLSPADINGDGLMDIVSCDYRVTGAPSEVGWWENNFPVAPVSHRQFWRSWMNSDSLAGAWGVDLADFNRDGWLDAAVSGYGQGAISGETRVLQNPGVDDELVWTQVYSYPLDESRGVTAYSRWRGQPRYLVATNSSGGQIKDFSSPWPDLSPDTRLTNLFDTYMALAADLSDNGTFDFLSVSGDRPDWFKTSTGTQVKLGVVYECKDARVVDVGDINGDGYLDIAAACPGESRLHWWQNDTVDGFGLPKTVPVHFPGVTDVKIADLDGDGQLEMVAASPGYWSIAWFKPNAEIGKGSTMGWVTDTFTGTEYITIADVDRDGRLDVVATSPSRDELYWFRNEITTPSACYSGCFTPYKLDEAQGGFREVAVGDVNNDGAPDIVAAVGDSVLEYRQVVTADISVDKWLDTSQSTGVVNGGEGIPYKIQITHNGPTGVPADVLIVDTWDPPNAVVAASGDGCTASPAEGVMKCTLHNLSAGSITELDVVITPSLSFDGYITNSVVITPLGLLRNENFSDTSDQAAPVQVNKDHNLYDMLLQPGHFPMKSIPPGGSFDYSVALTNLGPKSGVGGQMVNQWSPASAIGGFQVVGLSGASLSAMATSDCSGDPSAGTITCNLDNLDAGETITVTIGVSTSSTFDGVLENSISFAGDEFERNSSNNQTWPIRVGALPLETIYLPLILKN